MNMMKLAKSVLKFLLHILFAIYEREIELLMQLVGEVQADGLVGDEARKEVFRRFRERYADEIKDSLLNLLIEAVVVSRKG